METLLAYLWQASLVWTLLYAVYVIALQRDTFFNRNRAYLLGAMTLAVLLPLLPVLPTVQEKVPVGEVQLLLDETFEDNTAPKTVVTIPSATTITIDKAQPATIPFTQILLSIYGLGVVFFAFRFIRSLWQVIKLIRKNGLQKSQYAGIYQVAISPETPIFAFLNILFWYENEELTPQQRQKILLHELTHIRQLHTLDLLFVELLQIVFWFNPIVYFSKLSLQTLHEYLADRQAIGQSAEQNTDNQQYSMKEYAKLLVNQTFHTEVYSLSHSFFNSSLLKKRILMLQKKQTNRKALWKITMAIPMLIVAIFLVACGKEIYRLQSSEIEAQKNVMQKDLEYQNIKTYIPNANNQVNFLMADDIQYGVSVVAIDGNYNGLFMKVCRNRNGKFSEGYEVDKARLTDFFKKGDSPECTIEISQNGKRAKNVVILIGEYDISAFKEKAPEPPTAGSLQLSAKASSDPSEVTMTLRNDMDYTFEVTNGKAKLLFKETFGTDYQADKQGIVKISPQKDIGGYLLIEAEKDATVTMRYTPR